MVAEDRPNFGAWIAWNAPPNSGVTPAWSPVGDYVFGFDEAQRGRQYELGETMAAQPSVSVWDPDETLNPANTAGPYYGQIQPYRELLMLGLWPNDGAGNLLNVNTWGGPVDTTFEGYALGVTPPWVTGLVSTTPTVVNTNPRTGAQALGYDTAATTAQYGIEVALPCCPGDVMTTSAYVRQSSAATLALTIDSEAIADEWERTVAPGGWGDSDSGQTWVNSWDGSGAATDFWVVPGEGVHEHNGAGSTLESLLGSTVVADLDATISTRLTAPGTIYSESWMMRRSSAGNYVRAGIAPDYGTDQWQAIVQVFVGGVDVASDIVTTTIPLVDSVRIWMRVAMYGSTLALYIWRDGDPVAVDPQAIVASAAMPTGVFGLQSYSNSGAEVRFSDLTGLAFDIGSTTTTTGSYVRLSNTFTASQPQHRMRLLALSASVAGNVRIDDVMHEQGGTATTYDDEGAVIYPIMRGYAERFTRVWTARGYAGVVTIPTVDALAALNAITLQSELESAIAATKPTHWWRLTDGGDTTQFANSGFHDNPLSYVVSKYGEGIPPEAGSAIPLVGAPGMTGVAFQLDTTWLGSLYAGPGTPLVAGDTGPSSTPLAFPSTYGSTWSASASVWFTIPDPFVNISPFIVAVRPVDQEVLQWNPIAIIGYPGGEIAAVIQSVNTANIVVPSVGLEPGTHHAVAVVTMDPTTTTLQLYLDGELHNADTATTASLQGPWPEWAQATRAVVGGYFNGTNPDALLSQALLWDRAVTPDEIAAMWQAGAAGFAGESTSSRVTAHLINGGYLGLRDTDFETDSTMQAPTWSGRIDLLSDTQETMNVEGGVFWVAPTGALTARGRADRFLNLTPQWILGESGAEIPYSEDIAYDYDPTFIYANVSVSRNGGAINTAGTRDQVAAVREAFFPRAFSLSGDFGDDAQARDRGNWIFYGHSAAGLRVAEITVDPASNPELWHFCLSVDVNHRLQVIRRAKAGNAGAGVTMDADFFVEAVKQRQWNAAKGTWKTTLLLSPCSTDPGVNTQPWILGDSTWSVLDSTTIPGY
jgi:hypothetical protein